MRWRGGLCGLALLFGASGASFAQGRAPAGDSPARAEGSPTDSERARAIEAQLRAEPALMDDRVAIQVTGKNVRLSGTVDSADERTRAEEVVHHSDPTLTVENLLVTPVERDVAAVADKISEGGRKAVKSTKEVAAEVGDMVTDGAITSSVKAQLMAAEGVHASAMNVDTAGHVVTLRGTVRTESERQRALQIARHTRGVQKVVDQLELLRPAR